MPPRKEPAHDEWLDEIVSLADAAELRKIGIETLRSLVRQGRLKAVRLSDRKVGMTRREATGDLRDWPKTVR
jgi:predicted site-specific integrase-resolvase